MRLLLLGLFHLVGGALVADSYADFSSVQGSNGWSYQYYDTELSAKPLPLYEASWIGGTNAWQIVDSWCQISAGAFHPTTGGTTNQCSTPYGLCKPALRWTNRNYSDASIRLEASHTYPFLAGRDGVVLRLLKDGVELDNFTTPFTVNKTYALSEFNTVEAVLDPQLTCNNDETNIRLRVEIPDPTPSATPSITPSSSASRSPTGVCHTIFRNVYGTQEILPADGVVFTINHGSNVTHLPPFELCGMMPSCVESATTCVCTYSQGTSAYCPYQRSSIITYSLGPNALTFTSQSPTCVYRFSRSFVFPSPSPSPTFTPSITASMSRTATPSATGICNEIQNYVYGQFELISSNGVLYKLFHGSYITTPYLPNFDMLLGVFEGCTDFGTSCICRYGHGYNVGCAGGTSRNTFVNFTYGSAIQTRFEEESNCTYLFSASYIRPSFSPSPTVSSTITSSWTTSSTYTPSSTLTSTETSSWTLSPTATFTQSSTASRTASHTRTATVSATFSSTATPSATKTPVGICNDVRNYVFGRVDRPTPIYTLFHGHRLTHFYYPSADVLIGKQPQCIDYGTQCVCVYAGGDGSFCDGTRQGIVTYTYGANYKTELVTDSDPVCIYKFNTTFYPPYMSPSPTFTATPSPSPSFIQRFVPAGVRVLPVPSHHPALPPNGSHEIYRTLASEFVGTLNASADTDGLVSSLNVLASRLAAVNPNLALSIRGSDFDWIMTSAASSVPVNAGNVSAVLPALENGMFYSFIVMPSNSSFPTFSVDALGTSNNRYTISGLTTPLTFVISTTPPSGQTVECIYWNETDWDTDGCSYVNGTCACTHFTQFSARFAAVVDTNTQLFGAAGDVYSASGFVKYGAIYGTLIGLFCGLVFLFLCLLRLDSVGEQIYRLAVEDIEEVCKVLGYDKPTIAQPHIALPPPSANRSGFLRFATACGSRVLYQHSYFAVIFRFDPRLPRGFRLLLLATVAFHTLFLTTLLYGYSKASAEMSVVESVILSIITSLLNIPFIRIMIYLMNKTGIVEYESRFPEFAHEYNRRRAFETALRPLPTGELTRVVDRICKGKTPERAVQVSPASTVRGGRRNSVEYAANSSATTLVEADTENMVSDLFMRVWARCAWARCFRGQQVSGGFQTALAVASDPDPHWAPSVCNALPTKTLFGTFFALGAFAYIGWIMNYVLLFTASQSSDAMKKITLSFGVSQATSIFLTQPLTLALTLLGTWLFQHWRRGHDPHHIGYFTDPQFRKSTSSSLSGSWAYWIFYYGGTISSLGLSQDQKSLGYSSSAVALAWLEGERDLPIIPRDAVIATLYCYLRRIEDPPQSRASTRTVAAEKIKKLLDESSHSTFVPVVSNPSLEESYDVSDIVNRIADKSKDGRP